MISYEVCMGLILVSVIIVTGSLNLAQIVYVQLKSVWLFIPLYPLFLMFFICCVAEANRTPFDLVEAETELVSGYSVEYSALGYAMFFLGEYSNIFALSALNTILFLGG
jgi:NADH-quinone oxidoreductase subunit H